MQVFSIEEKRIQRLRELLHQWNSTHSDVDYLPDQGHAVETQVLEVVEVTRESVMFRHQTQPEILRQVEVEPQIRTLLRPADQFMATISKKGAVWELNFLGEPIGACSIDFELELNYLKAEHSDSWL